MIRMLRLDERMIHGQIAIRWARQLDVDRIIVANDQAAANEIVRKSLMMAAPPTCKTTIRSLDDTITLLADERCAALKILLICSKPDDLLKLAQNLKDIPLINIGNYGRIAAKCGAAARTAYKPNLYAYPGELAIFKELLSLGIACNYQTTPDETPLSLKNALGL